MAYSMNIVRLKSARQFQKLTHQYFGITFSLYKQMQRRLLQFGLLAMIFTMNFAKFTSNQAILEKYWHLLVIGRPVVKKTLSIWTVPVCLFLGGEGGRKGACLRRWFVAIIYGIFLDFQMVKTLAQVHVVLSKMVVPS